MQVQKVAGREESRTSTGPRVDFNFDYLDRERYSHSKKKLEVRKSERLAAALSVFDSTCDVEVRKMAWNSIWNSGSGRIKKVGRNQ